MTTGRINQVASALPRAWSPAGRAPRPGARRGVPPPPWRGAKGRDGRKLARPARTRDGCSSSRAPCQSPRPAIRPPGRRGPAWCAAPTPERARSPVPHRVRGRPPGARSTFQACTSHVRAPGGSGGSASPSRPLRGRPRPPRLRERGQRPSVLETLPSRRGRTTPPRRSGTPGRVLRGDCAGAPSRCLGGRRAPRTAAGNRAGRRRGPAGGQPHDENAAPRKAAGGATSHRYRAVAARLYNGPRRPRRMQETVHTGRAGPRGRLARERAP